MTIDEALAAVETDGDKAASWRPFQLAFILLQLPALTDPAHPLRSGEAANVELLFFPTGGGKTEAYLGLAAYTFAIRRLQGQLDTDDGVLDGGDGVAVLMRYTLRLLTSQQFQRAAALVCAAELIRQEDPPPGGRSRSASACGSAPLSAPSGTRRPQPRSRPSAATTVCAHSGSPFSSYSDAPGAARKSTPSAMCARCRRPSGSRSTAATDARSARSRSTATPPVRCRSSPSTTRSTATRPPSCSPRSTSTPAWHEKGRPPACSATSPSGALGTGTATRTPGARAPGTPTTPRARVASPTRG